MSTGTSLISRMRSSTVHPSISGSPTSRTTISGRWLWKARSPPRPLAAAVTAKPLLSSTVLMPSAMSRSSSITGLGRSPGRRVLMDGQEHAHRGSLVEDAVHRDVPVVHLDEQLDDGEPEPGARQARDPCVGRADERAE